MKTKQHLQHLHRLHKTAFILIGLVVSGMAFGATDRELSDVVREKLEKDEIVPEWGIRVETTNGLVRLKGEVDNLLEKERATRIAETVDGIEHVVNVIMVIPEAGLSDEQVRRNVRLALIDARVPDAYDIEVSVESGVVILQGEAASWQEQELAARIAKGAAGVRGLENHIEINLAEPREDETMEDESLSALQWNVVVDASNLSVNVSNGVATMKGTVGSVAERVEARQLAWVRGIQGINDEEVKVRSGGTRQRDVETITDDGVAYAVRAAITNDPVLHAYDIPAGFPAPELGTIALPKKIWALAVDGHTVYVANDDRLIALDASNPRALARVGERRTTWGATDVALDPESAIAIVTGPDSQRETFRDTIHRIDITDPVLMHQRAEARTDGWRSGIAIGGGFAFAGETVLQVYDLRAPDGLADATTLEIDGDINDKALHGDHLALAVEISEGGGMLRLVDVSAPAAPVLADTLDLIDWVRDVAIDPERGLAFAAAHEAGLFVIGLEGPPDPPVPAPMPERTPFPGDIRIHLPVVAKGGLAKACPAGP